MLFTKEFEEKIKDLKTEEEVANAIKAEYSDSDAREIDIDELENIAGGSYRLDPNNVIVCMECHWWYSDPDRGSLFVHYMAHRHLRHALKG